MVQLAESAGHRYAALRAHLDERQRRSVLGIEATELGRGGIKAIAAVTGVHPDTIARGVREVTSEVEPATWVRAPGGGGKPLSVTDPQIVGELRALVDPANRGDPMSALVWTTKSTRNLATALTGAGHPHHDHRPDRPVRPGLRGRPHRTALHQETGRSPAPTTPRLPRRLELHHHTTRHAVEPTLFLREP